MQSKRDIIHAMGLRLWDIIKAENPVAPTEPATPKRSSSDIPAGARWITVHGHDGGDGEGHPCLIMPAAGKKNVWHVIGGAGGKLTHMELHLKSPEEWAQHSKENAKKRKEKAAGQPTLTPDSKAAIVRAKQESQKQYVHRVAEQMGWNDYSDKTADDFIQQTNGNKAQAALLAHQYLNSYVSKANQAVKQLRSRLTVDREALVGADLHIDTSSDPYRADDADLVPGDISQRMSESQKVGNTEAVHNYQQALNSLSTGDTEAATTYLTAANKAAGIRNLTLQDVLPSANVAAPSGEQTVGKQAKKAVQDSPSLTTAVMDKRMKETADKVKNGDEADKYIGTLELQALEKAQQCAGGDPTKLDMDKAATYYLQAEKYRALRQKFGDDEDKFNFWKGIHERAQENAAGVAAIKNQGTFGAADVDPDVQDMSLARNLLAAKVLFDDRIKRLTQAQKSLDPDLIHSTVDDKDTLENSANWNQVYDEATKKAMSQIEQMQDTATAAKLDTAIDDPSAFLQGVGDGEPIDQQRLQRYITYGQQSATDLIGQVVGGQEMLPRAAYAAMGAKAASKLLASYLASHRTPEEFNAIRDGIANYHAAREADVANGALVAASAVIANAKEFKNSEIANVDNLYEAAKYNKLRMEAVDHALATIGTAYGELNATAETNFAMMNAKTGPQSLVIDGVGKDAGQMVNLAHALGLAPEDYILTDQEKNEEGGIAKPRGLALTGTGVSKLFHEAAPEVTKRRKDLMDIRAGKQDDLLPDGSRAGAEGWLPPYFAKWPASLWNANPIPPSPDSPAIESQVLSDPKVAVKAAAFALGKQPYGTIAFKKYGDLQPDDFKLVRSYFATHVGVPVSKEDGDTDTPSPNAPRTDAFGQPLLAQHAAGMTADESTKAWKDFIQRVGMKPATDMVIDAIKGDFINTFAPVYSAMANTPLQTTDVPSSFKNADRISIGAQAETQLAPLVDKLAWRYPQGTGDAGNAIPGVNMSGRYVNQQRVIKALLASGGLNGKEGGRLGALLGPGCVRGDTLLYNPVIGTTKTFHEWMISTDGPMHVLSYDEKTKRTVVAESTKPYIKDYDLMYKVSLSNGEIMFVTNEHRYLTPQGWKRLAELNPGSEIVAGARTSHDSAFSCSNLQLGDVQESKNSEKKQFSLQSFQQEEIVNIVSIMPTKIEAVYDLTVPIYQNYLAQGVVNHNSGKSAVMLGTLTSAISQGKARGGMIAEPSAVQGQMGQSLNGMIDPDAPFKWKVATGMSRDARAKVMADKSTHLVVLSHEQIRDDSLDALSKVWGTGKSETTKRFMSMTRKQRADAMKQAYIKAGWEHRLDSYQCDEAHVLANRAGKANSVLSNVSDAISDNAKYFMPATGTPLKNSVDEDADFLARLRPDEYAGKKQQEFVGRNSLIASQSERLQGDKEADVASGNRNRNWTNNSAAQALQYELTPNVFTGSAYIKAPVTYKNDDVEIKDEPEPNSPKSDGTLHGDMKAGLQKSAYDRVGQLEQTIKTAAMNNDWKTAQQAIKEISTADYKQKNGTMAVRHAFMDRKTGKEMADGSPEAIERTKKLVPAAGMFRDAAYNRILHTMTNGNMKTKALMSILDDLGSQDAADDNQPKDEVGNPVTDPAKRVKGKPVIIFTRSLDAVDNLTKKLRDKGYSVEGISGRDNGDQKILKKGLFQPSGNTKPRVNILIMSDAMSAGIDLPRAEAVIHYDTTDTEKTMAQRSARAIRLSTKHPVIVHSIRSNTPYEQKRVSRVKGKGALGDVSQNPADVIDDTGLMKYISDARSTQARQAAETPPQTPP